jgi:hypothetical protein
VRLHTRPSLIAHYAQRSEIFAGWHAHVEDNSFRANMVKNPIVARAGNLNVDLRDFDLSFYGISSIVQAYHSKNGTNIKFYLLLLVQIYSPHIQKQR